MVLKFHKKFEKSGNVKFHWKNTGRKLKTKLKKTLFRPLLLILRPWFIEQIYERKFFLLISLMNDNFSSTTLKAKKIPENFLGKIFWRSKFFKMETLRHPTKFNRSTIIMQEFENLPSPKYLLWLSSSEFFLEILVDWRKFHESVQDWNRIPFYSLCELATFMMLI